MYVRHTIAFLCMFAVLTSAGCASTDSHSNASSVNATSLESAITRLQVATPTYTAPVRLAATVVYHAIEPGANATLIVKGRITAGWHIYAQVPPDQPYAQTSLKMTLPAGAEPVGEWSLPEAHASVISPDLLEYSGTVVFTHPLLIDGSKPGDEVTVDVAFQACDMTGCLPPQTVTLRARVPAQ